MLLHNISFDYPQSFDLSNMSAVAAESGLSRCHFFVQRKKRNCRMMVKSGHKFCGEHAHMAADATDDPAAKKAKADQSEPNDKAKGRKNT